MIDSATNHALRRAENRIATAPGGREPPGDVLYRLRVVEPMIELHYIGGGRWALGKYEPSSYRRKVAGERKRDPGVQQKPRSWRMAWLTYHGFSWIDFFDLPNNQFGKVLRSYRRRKWRYNHRRREMVRESRKAGTNWRDRSSDEEFAKELEERIRANYDVIFDKKEHVPMS